MRFGSIILFSAITSANAQAGACCFSNGGCLNLSEANCLVASGDWKGVDASCRDINDDGIAEDCIDGPANFDLPKLYWTDRVKGKIQRSNLDGSNAENVLTGLSDPRGLHVNMVLRRMFWMDGNQNKIFSAALDGSDVQQIGTTLASVPEQITVHALEGKLYYLAATNDSYVFRMNLDGTNHEQLLWVDGIVEGGRIYDIALAIEPTGPVPAVGTWGLLTFGLVLLAGGSLIIRRSQNQSWLLVLVVCAACDGSRADATGFAIARGIQGGTHFLSAW